jgi:hypothetical protein
MPWPAAGSLIAVAVRRADLIQGSHQADLRLVATRYQLRYCPAEGLRLRRKDAGRFGIEAPS